MQITKPPRCELGWMLLQRKFFTASSSKNIVGHPGAYCCIAWSAGKLLSTAQMDTPNFSSVTKMLMSLKDLGHILPVKGDAL